MFEKIKGDTEELIQRSLVLSEAGVHEATDLFDAVKSNWDKVTASFSDGSLADWFSGSQKKKSGKASTKKSALPSKLKQPKKASSQSSSQSAGESSNKSTSKSATPSTKKTTAKSARKSKK